MCERSVCKSQCVRVSEGVRGVCDSSVCKGESVC